MTEIQRFDLEQPVSPTGASATMRQDAHGYYVLARDYDALAAKLSTCEKYRDAYAECDRIGTQAVRELEAKLAKVEAERDAFASNIPDAAQNLIRNAHTGRLKALRRAVVAEAALPAVYRLAMEDAEQAVEEHYKEVKPHDPDDKCPADLVSHGYGNACFNIGFTLNITPTPTAAELMARIQTGEKE